MTDLRLLDLGCADGSIASWVAGEIDGEVLVDGLELDPTNAACARERLGASCGEIVEADAREAERHFAPASYDAVICFELIEHIPEPEQLLEVAERMLKPGGVIYISTPDGTFGQGSNPNHLRVYRAHDLADVLRRRGRLHDLTVGVDGVSVAAYTPEPRRGEIVIHTGGAWAPWSPIDIERKGLGGSETAAVRLAEQLSVAGYVVTVYGEVEQCAYRNVIFRHHSAFDPSVRTTAFISSRIPELFDRPINSPVRMLWVHDVDCGDRLGARRAEPIDHILTLSAWHARHVGGVYPYARPKIRQIRNGIELDYFRTPLEEPRAQRLIYTSSPDRGLDVLLELWPQIRAEVPEAVFSYCYADVYDTIADQDPSIGAFRDKIRALADQDGVQPLGSLPQPELARLMRTSMVWAHPSWSSILGQPFNETSCIGAMEAQAAGCLVVASDWGALSETVGVGRLVGGVAPAERWKAPFVRETIDGFTNPETQAWAQQSGPKVAAGLGWEGVAKQIIGLIDGEVWAFQPPPKPTVR